MSPGLALLVEEVDAVVGEPFWVERELDERERFQPFVQPLAHVRHAGYPISLRWVNKRTRLLSLVCRSSAL